MTRFYYIDGCLILKKTNFHWLIFEECHIGDQLTSVDQFLGRYQQLIQKLLDFHF